MFASLARFVIAVPRAILAGTLLFLAGAAALGGNVAAQLDGVAANDPGAGSARAAAVLDSQFPGSRPDLALLVEPAGGPDGSHSGDSVDEPAIAAQGRQLAEALAAEPGIAGVSSYWQSASPTLRSRDGRQALIVARIAAPDENGADAVFNRLQPRYAGTRGDLSVQLGGGTAVRNAVRDTVTADLLRAEAVALPLTLLVLVVVFGSAVAAAMPVLTGVLVIAGTSAALTLIARFATVSVFALNLTTALALGLAIDYGLLIVRRFRQELAGQAQRGRPDPAAAVRATLRTAGRTVLFSASILAVSLAAMLVFPTPFLRSFAYAGLSVVAMATLAVLLPLPAALVLLGPRVDALRIPLGRGDRAARQARERRSRARWEGLANAVMSRAPLFCVATVALLVALALPFAKVEFATVDHRQLPDGTPARVVQQDIKDRFDSQATGVIDVVVPSTDPDAVAGYAAQLSTLAGVVRVDSPQGTFQSGRSVAPAQPGRTAGGWSLVSVAPAASIEDVSPQSQAMVRTIRDQPAPAGTLVGGQAAELLDTRLAIRHGLPWALAIIALGTLVLLFLLTGSVLLPVKALVVNALSLTAMFGAVVWVFQQGHLSGPLGFTPTGFIEMSLPVLMFCLAFGLSMDYGTFLVARIKEEYDRSGDNRRAVAAGLARTGGIITSAAAVMAIVLVAVGMSRIMNMQMLGLGVALAVVIDATVVRCLLVPSTMAIAGRATWWAPRPLDALSRRRSPEMSGQIPAAPGHLPVLGHGLPMMRRPLAFLDSLPAIGPIVQIRMGAMPAYVVNDPELARQVLVGIGGSYDQGLPVHKARPLLGGGVGMLDGEEHRWHRRLMQPALSRAQIAGYAPTMSELAVRWCDSLQPGQRLDVADQMNELALLTVATTLFSADLSEAVAEVQRVLPVALRHLPSRAILPDWLLRLPLPANRAFDAATSRLHQLTREAVAATRASGADRTDLISTLLASRDEETGAGLSDEQVNDQLVNMLVAGSETTGSTLAWAFHELAGAAEAETRLHTELDTVLAGRPATFEDLADLPYTRCVIQETLRRYPPYLILRHAPGGARLGGHHLPAGASILISPYVLHRDPRVFSQPTRFEPDRWAAAGAIGRTASVPFGLGGRQCPGNHFALTELTIHLATIAGRWRLRRAPGPPVAEVTRGVTIHPDRLPMLAEPRHPNLGHLLVARLVPASPPPNAP